MVTYLGSLVQLCCGGVGRGTLQTNIMACVGSACSVWATLGLPLLMMCVLSRSTLLRLPGCSAGELSKVGPGFCALPRSKLLRFRFLGTPQRCRLCWACVLCPSQIQAAQVMRCLARAIAATYHLPTARLSRCTTGTPSQADVDCPDPQEVLVSKEACLQLYR